VAVRGAAIRLGDAVIDLRTVPVWRPRPLPVLVPGIARRSEALLAAALARGGAPWIPAAIGSALESDDPAPAVSALLGRGTGLTPAGDDALLGAIAACWCLRAAHPVAAANHARLAPAVSQRLAATTDLSAALLRQAAAGHYSRPVHDALAALLGGGAMDDLQLFTVGATSGADCALGIAAAVDHIIGRQPDKVTA
jgi:hypothetical protein